jgi:hypothetical protein
MSERDPLNFSIHWTHFVIAVSLSPRARKNAIDDTSEALNALARLTRASSGARLSIERLPPVLVTLPLLDLGPCPRALEPLLTRALRGAARRQETFKVTPDGWTLSAEAAGRPRCLSLSLRDRALRLESLSASLAEALSARGCECAPTSVPRVPLALISALSSHEQRLRAQEGALLEGQGHTQGGAPHEDELTAHLSHLPPPQRTPIWVNELVLLRRPHAYHPRAGYEVACAVPLPIGREGGRMTEQKEAQKTHAAHEMSPDECLTGAAEMTHSASQERAHTSDSPREQTLLDALERRLAERSQPLQRPSPPSTNSTTSHPPLPPTPQRPKRRRRPSRSSHTHSGD